MSNRAFRTIILGVILPISIITVVARVLHQYRPMIKTNEWTANFTNSEGTVSPASVYRVIGWDVLFVRIKESDSPCEWFSVDTPGHFVAIPNAPGRTPYLHFKRGMSIGIPITDRAKLADTWNLTWSGSSAHWTNGKVSFDLSPIGAKIPSP